jgi:biopolymer transport protein ExbB
MSLLPSFSRTKPFARLLLAGLLALAVCSPARAWWNSDWSQRKSITVDTTATGVALADSPGAVAVLLRLHDGNFSFGSAKDDGSDLRFVTEDDKTPLAYHIEKYDPVLNEAFVWVKIPNLKAGAKTAVWLYFGNTKATPATDAKGTYDTDTALVWHLGESGAPAADASGNGNTAQNSGLADANAMIGGGLRLDGKGAVTLPAAPSLAWSAGGAMTWSAWVKPAAPQPNATLFSRRDGAAVFRLGLDNGAPFVEVNTQRSSAGAPLAPASWHHLAAVAEGAKVVLYVDGEPYATLATALPALAGPALVGGDSLPGGAGFSGELDELEISKVARSPGFIKFASVNQGPGDAAGKLLALGADEQPKDWLSWMKGGYFGIILSSLTVDGWVVICILMVMSAVSWLVMINKVSFLNSQSRGNALFMKEWSQIANDLTVLDHLDEERAKTLGGRVDAKAMKALRRSSIYRIYQIGAQEIRHRLMADRSSKVLSARSIQAIRASLDGGIVRESQRLNRMIVLLTIAISGGPFLGLLGTVVGVMITFASVAAAGEVNVNAIAPGIAAALLATVAGLAVAIPALFGYNYILTRIKDTSSDMHVFIDEFVTRMAEYYSDTAAQSRALTRAPFAPSEPRG